MQGQKAGVWLVGRGFGPSKKGVGLGCQKRKLIMFFRSLAGHVWAGVENMRVGGKKVGTSMQAGSARVTSPPILSPLLLFPFAPISHLLRLLSELLPLLSTRQNGLEGNNFFVSLAVKHLNFLSSLKDTKIL